MEVDCWKKGDVLFASNLKTKRAQGDGSPVSKTQLEPSPLCAVKDLGTELISVNRIEKAKKNDWRRKNEYK